MPEDARPDPQDLNLDPALCVREDSWQLERHRNFVHTWQFMGLASALAEAGRYLAIDISSIPIFAIRGRNGNLRGFRNVCRH